MKVSVLMSVYRGDVAEFLNDAIDSITILQTHKPDEVVLVVDGWVNEGIESVLRKWESKRDLNIKIKRLPENVGLAKALNSGLEACQNEYIARMDSDDISLPERLEKQVEYFKAHPELDLLGGWYIQKDESMKKTLMDRKVPCGFPEIKSFSRFRTPINHVTVMFKKSSVLAIGGYPNMDGYMEDWWLSLMLIKNDFKIENLADYLVWVRGGDDFISRRGGMLYFVQEVDNLRKMNNEGLMSFSDLVKNLMIRIFVRITPVFVRSLLYKGIRKI